MPRQHSANHNPSDCGTTMQRWRHDPHSWRYRPGGPERRNSPRFQTRRPSLRPGRPSMRFHPSLAGSHPSHDRRTAGLRSARLRAAELPAGRTGRLAGAALPLRDVPGLDELQRDRRGPVRGLHQHLSRRLHGEPRNGRAAPVGFGIYVDSVLTGFSGTATLGPNFFPRSPGPARGGLHTFILKCDSQNADLESDENDNYHGSRRPSCRRVFAAGAPRPLPQPPNPTAGIGIITPPFYANKDGIRCGWLPPARGRWSAFAVHASNGSNYDMGLYEPATGWGNGFRNAMATSVNPRRRDGDHPSKQRRGRGPRPRPGRRLRVGVGQLHRRVAHGARQHPDGHQHGRQR